MRFLNVGFSAAAMGALVLGMAGDAEAQRGRGNFGGGRPGNPSGGRVVTGSQGGRSYQQIVPNQPGRSAPSIAPFQPGRNTASVGGGFRGFNLGGGFASPSYTPSNQPRYTPSYSGYTPSYALATTPQYTPSYQPAPYVPQVAYSQAPIQIMLPFDSPYEVNYMLNDWDYSMAPGEKQTFTEDREWVIQFDRGRGLGHSAYSLEPGTYKFVRDEATGWQLYRVSDTVASGNGFHAISPAFGD